MSNDIKITISGNDAAMIAVWQRQQAQILKNQAALEKLATAGERAGKGISSGVEGGTASLQKFIGAITGVGTVVGGISVLAATLKREYDDLLKRQKAAADIQISLADAETQLLGNLGKDKEVNVDNFRQLTRKGARETGLSQRDFTIAYSDALSARGDRSAMDAHRATVAAGKVLSDNPESAKLLSGAALDVAKKGGMTEEQAIGVLVSIGRAARVTSMQGTAEHIAPGALGIMDFDKNGGDIKKAGALISAASLGENDPTGRRSRTLGISLAKQLEERYPELADTDARIRAVQDGGEKEWKKFFGGGKYKIDGKTVKKEGATFEASGLPFARGVLKAGSKDAKEYESALENVASPEQGQKVFDDLMRDKGKLASVQLARRKRLLAEEAESTRIDDILGGQTSVDREGLSEILEAHGAGVTHRGAASVGFLARTLFGQSSGEAAAGELRASARSIRLDPGNPADENEKNARSLEMIADRLIELIDLQKKSNDTAERIRDNGRNEPVPLAGPGAANQGGGG